MTIMKAPIDINRKNELNRTNDVAMNGYDDRIEWCCNAMRSAEMIGRS